MDCTIITALYLPRTCSACIKRAMIMQLNKDNSDKRNDRGHDRGNVQGNSTIGEGEFFVAGPRRFPVLSEHTWNQKKQKTNEWRRGASCGNGHEQELLERRGQMQEWSVLKTHGRENMQDLSGDYTCRDDRP